MLDQSPSAYRGRIVLIGLLFVFGIIIWYIGRAWLQKNDDPATPVDATETVDTSLANVRFLTAKEVLARISRQENLILLDVRTRNEFDVEHIVDSLSVPVTTLATYSPPAGALLIIITGPDIPNQTIKGIDTLFKERQYTFAFLQGGLTEWNEAGGSTISTGDPESLLDYSKVIFVNLDEIEVAFNAAVNPRFLDVRSKELFEKEHLPEAINIPLNELEKRRSEIPRGTSLFVYGANDYESYQGGVRLFDLNFFGTRVIKDGLIGWKEKGLPLITPETKNVPPQKKDDSQ
ncbi:MAG: rhodanese-like domain-containing protein [Candidatus Moraniibacteriota bacterium]|nr:MAG: rhodanese-like domain-containing protein [Candidatus Moranbacteria bacterium]